MLKTPTSALLKELSRGATAGERHGPLLGRQWDHSHNLGLGGEWLASTWYVWTWNVWMHAIGSGRISVDMVGMVCAICSGRTSNSNIYLMKPSLTGELHAAPPWRADQGAGGGGPGVVGVQWIFTFYQMEYCLTWSHLSDTSIVCYKIE